jgi:hypothetical protein
MRNFIRAAQNVRGFRKLHQRISPSGVELWRPIPGCADRSCSPRRLSLWPSRGLTSPRKSPDLAERSSGSPYHHRLSLNYAIRWRRSFSPAQINEYTNNSSCQTLQVFALSDARCRPRLSVIPSPQLKPGCMVHNRARILPKFSPQA